MKAKKFVAPAAFGLVLFISTAAQGLADGPWRHLPDDARWAVVVCVHEYLRSDTGKRLTERFHDENAARWHAGVRRHFGMDPMTEVNQVIVYGPDAERDSGATVILGSFSSAAALDFLSGHPSYRRLDHRRHHIHRWHAGAAAYPQPGVAVLGRRARSVRRVLDTLDGERPHLAAEVFGAMPAEGWFLRAFALDVSAMRGMPPQAAVLRYSSRLDLSLGEREGAFQGMLRLEPAEGTSVSHLADMLRALLNFAPHMGEPDDPHVVLARHARVTLGDDGDSVTVSFDVPISRLPF